MLFIVGARVRGPLPSHPPDAAFGSRTPEKGARQKPPSVRSDSIVTRGGGAGGSTAVVSNRAAPPANPIQRRLFESVANALTSLPARPVPRSIVRSVASAG